MPRIYLLSEHTACRIAAGEVIERPVSIVKELVENSLDAGANIINIAITGGGIEAIEVVDNGCGISQEDTPLAFQRHATSKIKSIADLNCINTLGFRGEALPSIAAVARLSIKTRVPENNMGYHMVIKGGQVLRKEPVGCPVGTLINVQDIFYNTPARRKHLKSKSTEGGLIADMVYKMALIRPQTRFIFSHNGREIFRSPGSGNTLDVLASVYDVRTANMMLAINNQEQDIKVEGYISKPELSRSTRQQITVAVNGRVVRSRSINNALIEAYRGKLTAARYPVAVLLIWLPPDKIDVNVHPAKMEVKLSNEEHLQLLITDAVRRALRETGLIPHPVKMPATSEPFVLNLPSPANQHKVSNKGQAGAGNGNSLKERVAASYVPACDQQAPAGSSSSGNKDELGATVTLPSKADDHHSDQLAEVAESYKENPAFPDLRIVGQLLNAYILAQAADGLFIIDQHAAHERVLFEKFFKQLSVPNPQVQYLLKPVNINLRLHEQELLKEYAVELRAVGFVFEDFGQGSLLLRGIPAEFPPGQSEQLLADVAESIMEQGKISSAKTKHALASLLACKAAIKAGERLSTEAMEALVARLAGAGEPYTCPHGRPTVVSFTRRELDVMFKRT
ncbi:DNA mismatch repair endonuclease MutL [Desulfallas thermosapovorans]|uniref:DNA mismatch repair protein MutL n=1 Tax=Desulfallas thermosapovorans DSM 6562 TaxID=1121431 RepID=A0A5S4ZXJ8_9FIRM|nr:DNA mismatch repair endonuclease MutL [Desulfallas thermosapovorans]TYO97804.1 DNA mismatch repair protein MutL [Desulfallas thermosapovorans DSM 6562]